MANSTALLTIEILLLEQPIEDVIQLFVDFHLVIRNVGEMIGKIWIVGVIDLHVFACFRMHAFAKL